MIIVDNYGQITTTKQYSSAFLQNTETDATKSLTVAPKSTISHYLQYYALKLLDFII